MTETLRPYASGARDKVTIEIGSAASESILDETAAPDATTDERLVARLAQRMRCPGEWRPGSLLTFARSGVNRLQLIDGYHRLRALATLPANQPPVRWTVRVTDREEEARTGGAGSGCQTR